MDSQEYIIYKCPKCEGKPLPNITTKNGIVFTNVICDFCYGKKELNWIENIFGVIKSKWWGVKTK